MTNDKKEALWAIMAAVSGVAVLVALAVFLPQDHTPSRHQVIEALVACNDPESKIQEYGTPLSDLRAVRAACRDLENKAKARAQMTGGAERASMLDAATVGRDVAQIADDVIAGADPNDEASKLLPDVQKATSELASLGGGGQ
jgi:hypothetical protein